MKGSTVNSIGSVRVVSTLTIRWRRRCSSRTFRSVGTVFLTELRQCEASQGAYVRPAPFSLFDLILRRRKLDQTTLAGAQRSCCSLFHFHRAVFWPDRTRSCPQPANAVFPRVIPPENLSIDPPPFRAGSSCRACPAEHSAFSRSFAGREVVARCTGVTSILGVRLDVSTVLS